MKTTKTVKYVALIFLLIILSDLFIYKYGNQRNWLGKTHVSVRRQLKEMGVRSKNYSYGIYPSGKISLDLRDNKLNNLSALAFMPLEELTIFNSQVKDISSLYSCDTLRVLRIYNSPVYDLTPLLYLKCLDDVVLVKTDVSDVSSLKEIQLETLDLSFSPVTDISNINTSRLVSLSIVGTGITNLSTLNPDKLLSFNFSVESMPDNENGLEVIRKMTNCVINYYSDSKTFWKEYDEKKLLKKNQE